MKNGKEVSDVPAYLQSLYRASVQPYLISWFKYNPRTVIASVKVPVLIVQGKNDIQVSVEDAELLKKGCPAAELLLIDKMNHVLKDCESKDVLVSEYGSPLASDRPEIRQLYCTVTGRSTGIPKIHFLQKSAST